MKVKLYLKMFFKASAVMLAVVINVGCTAQKRAVQETSTDSQSKITPGAERLSEYLPILKGKRVAVFANHTSVVGEIHLIDTLVKLGVNVKLIFAPEHGFRGTADAGENIEATIDKATNIPIVSLYGRKRKPSDEDLKEVDLLLFDIQDVGARFYTYISHMQEYMESALEHNLPLMILDRPNPNGFYVDGPVLEEKFKSFVGMQPVPIAYGMTMGEYAQMILQEGWLSKEANEAYQRVIASRYREGSTYFHLDVIPCANYTHKSKY
ncbi:MAG: DUF1343 domain-containing protein, partial [Chitinophagaceae bacterium]|nr:DUF1343 domain-containing protein [Chitinophagaceae bacterium]